MKQTSELRDLCASAVSPLLLLLVAALPHWAFVVSRILLSLFLTTFPALEANDRWSRGIGRRGGHR